MTTINAKQVDVNVIIGVDLGDVESSICILDELSIPTTQDSFLDLLSIFSDASKVTIAMETGTHSPWLSNCLVDAGYDVLVGNARKLRMIWGSANKSDRRDAHMLARIARFDRELLSPVHHRSNRCQRDLSMIKARHALVAARSKLINVARGLSKSCGYRLPSCSSESFAKTVRADLDRDLKMVLSPLLESIDKLNQQIRAYNKRLERLTDKDYPQAKHLQSISGVGPLTSLAFVLTLESADRFAKSRDVGPFLGLIPKRDQSGQSDKPLGITKAGNCHLRCLLVNAANYIMGPFGVDCDLRRMGERIAARGGIVARRKAKIAVARKLAVVMHHLWKTGECYQPLMKNTKKQKQAA